METIPELTSQINFHCKIHALISILGFALCFILIGIGFIHLPLLITLLATCSITVLSVLIGRTITPSSSRSKIMQFFIIQILALAAWDFGGVICVVSIILDSHPKVNNTIFAVISTSCCVVYVGVFIYFWRSFFVANKILIIFNKAMNSMPKRYSVYRAKRYESKDSMAQFNPKVVNPSKDEYPTISENP